MNFRGSYDDIPVLHTGIFLSDEDMRSLNMSWGDRALGSLTGRALIPTERLAELCRAYGLPGREDGARWAFHPDSRELLYAFPELKDTPTVSATFADGEEVTIHNADLVAAAIGTRGVEKR